MPMVRLLFQPKAGQDPTEQQRDAAAAPHEARSCASLRPGSSSPDCPCLGFLRQRNRPGADPRRQPSRGRTRPPKNRFGWRKSRFSAKSRNPRPSSSSPWRRSNIGRAGVGKISRLRSSRPSTGRISKTWGKTVLLRRVHWSLEQKNPGLRQPVAQQGRNVCPCL